MCWINLASDQGEGRHGLWFIYHHPCSSVLIVSKTELPSWISLGFVMTCHSYEPSTCCILEILQVQDCMFCLRKRDFLSCGSLGIPIFWHLQMKPLRNMLLPNEFVIFLVSWTSTEWVQRGFLHTHTSSIFIIQGVPVLNISREASLKSSRGTILSASFQAIFLLYSCMLWEWPDCVTHSQDFLLYNWTLVTVLH